MKIRDIILAVLIIGMIISTTTLVVFANSGISDIKDTTTESSSGELLAISTKNLSSVAAGVRNALDRQLNSQYDQVKFWALSPQFQTVAIEAQDYTYEELEARYAPLSSNLQPDISAYMTTVVNSTHLEELVVTDSRGLVIAASRVVDTFDVRDEHWYKQVMNPQNRGFYSTKAYWHDASQKWVIDMAATMKYGGLGEEIGIFKATLNYTGFMGQFFSASGIDCYEVKGITGSGLIMGTSHGNKTKVDNPDFIIWEYQYYKDANARSLRVGALDPVAYQDENGEMVYAEVARSTIQGETTIVASEIASYIDNPINSFVDGLRDGITEKANSVRTMMIIIGVVVAVLVIIIAFLIIRAKITVPLNKLTVVSNKLSQGEIDGLTIDVQGKDEISTFGESFKGVLAAFNFLKDEVEKKS